MVFGGQGEAVEWLGVAWKNRLPNMLKTIKKQYGECLGLDGGSFVFVQKTKQDIQKQLYCMAIYKYINFP